MGTRQTNRDEQLRNLFEDLHGRFHRAEFLARDPLLFAHRFRAREDREVVALLGAAFASGNIKAIMAVMESLLAVLGPRPANWLRERDPADLRGCFSGTYHRWVRPEDIEVLLALLGGVLREHRSLGALWRRLDDPSEDTVLPTLARFVEAIRAMPVEPLASRVREARRADGKASQLASIESILLTSPERGSACKRMNLFLRWVVRPDDGVDLGLWTSFVSPARLVMPVDVYVLRLCRRLRLTRRRLPDLKAASEITARLRRLCPEDPCRYDFSMVRLGTEPAEATGPQS